MPLAPPVMMMDLGDGVGMVLGWVSQGYAGGLVLGLARKDSEEI
jgi:hypothetical protein